LHTYLIAQQVLKAERKPETYRVLRKAIPLLFRMHLLYYTSFDSLRYSWNSATFSPKKKKKRQQDVAYLVVSLLSLSYKTLHSKWLAILNLVWFS